jgi:methionyl aminopeptidase
MSISSAIDLEGIKNVSEAVGTTLRKMTAHATPGMSAKELDEFGRDVLQTFGARSAPKVTYGFPGYTCISVNNEIAHGIPTAEKIFNEGDLINIDVSAELNGYWADNGGSFILGEDIHKHDKLVSASKRILLSAIARIKGGVRIADIGKYIETEAAKKGFSVIRNLVGHGVGRALHEEPFEIPCYFDRFNKSRFRKNAVVAIETFISTKARRALDKGDGWTFITGDGSFVAQHEHTILITDGEPIILTSSNGIVITE